MEEICKGFPLSDFIKSDTATRLNINNNPSNYFKGNMQTFCPIIEYLDKLSGGRLEITSGYRSPQVNFYADGANNSYHTIGLALDIRPGVPFHVAEKIIANMDPSITTIRYDRHLHMHKSSRNSGFETQTYTSKQSVKLEQDYIQDFSAFFVVTLIFVSITSAIVKFTYLLTFNPSKH